VENSDRLTLIATVAASYLRRNSVGIDQIGTVITSVTRAVEQAAKELAGETAVSEQPVLVAEKQAPAVPVKRSVQQDHVICLEDGFRAKTLKRHLKVAHDLTPQQYRAKWELPRDYPMVAPAYRESRSQMAKQLGLGQKMAEGRAAKPKRAARGTGSRTSRAAK
jgi:predicted transcriptional regulator